MILGMRTKRLLPAVVAALLALSALPLRAESPSAASQASVQVFDSHIPLGIEGFFVRPARQTLYVLSTATSPIFQGWQLRETSSKHLLQAADGAPVRYFPRNVSFRVTASALMPQLLDVDRDFLDGVADLNAYLLRLGFQLKIFHGLQVQTLEPDRVEFIGMPADVPYDERVYRASFTLPQVPIEDRIVLEVLSPGGDRLCKFHLEF